jgi:hypothetical protein
MHTLIDRHSGKALNLADGHKGSLFQWSPAEDHIYETA